MTNTVEVKLSNAVMETLKEESEKSGIEMEKLVNVIISMWAAQQTFMNRARDESN